MAGVVLAVFTGAALADGIDSAAKLAFAGRLERGDGTAPDPAKALGLYCDLAKQGNADAAYAAAWIYLRGAGTQRDSANGLAWLGVADRHGNAGASRWLALLGDAPRQPPHCRILPAADRDRIPRSYLALATQAAAEFNVELHLLLAVMATESRYQPDAVSPKNAKGLMQLTDGTARRFGVTDIFDPAQNIRGGARYLQWLLSYFSGDLALALAGYNAGEQAVLRYGGVPPFVETRTYLEKIRARFTGAKLIDGLGPANARLPTVKTVDIAPPPEPDVMGMIQQQLGAARIF